MNAIPDSLFERMFVSVIAFMISVMMCKLWYDHRDQILERVVQDEEYRAQVKQKMNEVWQLLLFFTTSFVLKGYYRPADKRKGSARHQYNNFLNVVFAITVGFSLIMYTEAIYMEGYIGLVTRTILLFVLFWYLAEIRMIYNSCDLIHSTEFLCKGDIMDFRLHRHDREFPVAGRYKIIDIHLKGNGGVICVDENNNQIVDIPSTSARRAMVEPSQDE
ncbi:hypothetical protein COLO4_19209 [Corchorus olitorius]|uniref:Uncharacterized protein n=1 Tax=Corchorus olitorius TaxID=93759 RepID=A0A1R3J6B9_9ROSI|nr:hypothetical protein COLO4_19209 [Corchorus olitorius]